MAKNINDFQQKLQKLCDDNDVFLKQVIIRKERKNGPHFIDYSITQKVEDEETPQVISEISRFSS